MNPIKTGYLLIILILMSHCNLLKNTSGDDYLDGYYHHKIQGKKQWLYFHVKEEPLYIYPDVNPEDRNPVDTSNVMTLFRYMHEHRTRRQLVLSRSGIDIDLMTIPVKYRPPQSAVPSQLNAVVNGEIYLGFRKDLYLIKYRMNPLGKSEKNINQIGFSLGAFTGFGNTFISPTNTNNILDQEYDGIAWSKGFASIFAINKLTLGLTLGWDTLLDNNRDIWIYQGKSWLGVSLGVNLN